MIIIKSNTEIRKMKKSNQIVATILSSLKQKAVIGVPTILLEEEALRLTEELGAIPAFKGYKGYPHALCVSINEEIVHGMPSSRKLKEGDVLSIDYGVIVDGYYGDSAITIPIGAVSPNANKLIKTTEECLYIGIEKAVEGVPLGNISCAIQQHAENNGFNVIRDYVGHGIGRELHEEPKVRNYGGCSEGITLKAGMTIAIEPMLVEGGFKTKTLKDGWTVITADGKLAAHFEHTIAIQKGKALILSDRLD